MKTKNKIEQNIDKEQFNLIEERIKQKPFYLTPLTGISLGFWCGLGLTIFSISLGLLLLLFLLAFGLFF